MLTWARKHPWLAGLTIVGALLILLFVGSFFVQTISQLCTYDEQYQETDCTNYHLGPFVLAWLFAYTAKYNGFVTAIATIAVAAFTIVLANVTGRMVTLARDEFSVMHRPKVVVRRIELQRAGGEPDLIDSEPMKICVFIVNVGDTEARVREIVCSIIKSPTGRIREPIHEPEDAKAFANDEIVLQVGISKSVDRTSRWSWDHLHRQDFMPVRMLSSAKMLPPKNSIYCVGYITYVDNLGLRRRTGFHRRFDFETLRFKTEKDSEYEYSG